VLIAPGRQRAAQLEPRGLMIVVRATHLCMAMRGAQTLGQPRPAGQGLIFFA